MAKRVMVIGLDCAAPQHVFDGWLDELPTILELLGEPVLPDMKGHSVLTEQG